ncbi:hypothetical protein P4H94_04355 [Paenibacillus macerans]|uniref:hypothetical protein n=1 Tax=Paenibacillus macerans TaxID=44252 RepID=UPI002DB859B9|nr:hypothetical protein [Paenibacillus macerans]MEC0136119.1 hypothetical protein [Paenibacillus macerans]
MEKMYRGVTNSPKTELVALITETDTEIEVNDISVLLPNEGVAVIGNGDVAETVKYLEVEGNVLKGCIRGYEGIARSWTAGTRVARNFAASDWNTAIDNIEGLYGRFDDEKTVPLTLQPGLQVVTAAKDARFKLNQITGKTEINGQGRIGIIGVENPYVINTADNLLPPFYEWDNTDYGGGASKLLGPYAVEQQYKDASNRARLSKNIPVIPGRTYTLSYDITKNPPSAKNALFFYWMDANQVRLPGEGVSTRKYKGTYIVPTGAFYMEMLVIDDDYGDGASYKSQVVTNPMLVISTEPKPFEPQRKSMLAFQTELHANPSDGSDPDVLFEQNGEYRKLAKWRKVIADGSPKYLLVPEAGLSSFKVVYIDGSASNSISGGDGDDAGNFFGTKYNGQSLIVDDSGVYGWTSPDLIRISSPNIYISIANTDSGWGPDYTPTQEEIKAYFLGWKMYTDGAPNAAGTYDGTGVKAWVKLNEKDYTSGWTSNTLTLPTVKNPDVEWYQFLYRLAKDIVEPVVSEGDLLLAEGDNMVEVGTGIVLREHAPIVEASGSAAAMGDVNAPTKFKIKRFLTAYKNDRPDYAWQHSAGNAYGEDKARILWADYNREAAYTLTYFKLDKSPVVTITGSLAANEKAQISDLTAGVAEALRRVSVVEQKKAEKDVPGWLTPTLLNGATPYGTITPQYMKQNGRVYLRGEVVLTALNTVIFKLPVGYRPDRLMRFLGYSYSNQVVPGEIWVEDNGDVRVPIGGLAATSFDGISFLAK